MPARPPATALMSTATARVLPALLALAWLMPPAAQAADPAPAPAKAEAKPASAAASQPSAKASVVPAKPVAVPAKPAPAAAADPMDTLREKLAAKLDAHPAPQAKSPYVVRVVSRGVADGSGQGPARGTGRASAPSARVMAMAHLADKARAAGPAGHFGHPHWGYQGDAGPAAWASLKPEFATCGNGQRQSPIDIRGGIRVELEPVNFDYRPSSFGVLDNGHTVQVNVAPGNAIEVMGRRYDLQQFHFHRPSEERIEGRQFDMVAHLVHKDAEGRTAVVAVLLERGSLHPLVQSVWNNLPLEKGEELRAGSALDLNQLLPADRRYYTYMGSLTTPPCSEGVLWMVMAQPVGIASEQIAVFSRLYPMNARPVQQAAGRLIKQSQ